MIRSLYKLLFLGATLLGALTLGSPVLAADSAQEFVQSKQARVTSLLHEQASTQRDKQIAAVLDGMIDYEELAKRSLATHWTALSETQRKDFSEVLKRLVQRNYERNIKNILDYRIEYLGEDTANDSVVVHTRASSNSNKREEPIAIDYQLAHSGETWRVLDIVTEGSSLTNNYKNQFHRVIQKDGYDALVKRMKDKLAKNQSM